MTHSFVFSTFRVSPQWAWPSLFLWGAQPLVTLSPLRTVWFFSCCFKNFPSSLSFRSLTVTYFAVGSCSFATLGCRSVWICVLRLSSHLGSLGRTSDAFSILSFLSPSRAGPTSAGLLATVPKASGTLVFVCNHFSICVSDGITLLVHLQVD